MGWSCTMRADTSLKALMNIMGAKGLSNSWEWNGNQYFYEIGREQPDGSITGEVYIFLPDNKARRYGSLKIMPNGNVLRFPGTPKAARINASQIPYDIVMQRRAAAMGIPVEQSA